MGKGPREMRMGPRFIRISPEARRDWRRKLESGSDSSSPDTP